MSIADAMPTDTFVTCEGCSGLPGPGARKLCDSCVGKPDQGAPYTCEVCTQLPGPGVRALCDACKSKWGYS